MYSSIWSTSHASGCKNINIRVLVGSLIHVEQLGTGKDKLIVMIPFVFFRVHARFDLSCAVGG